MADLPQTEHLALSLEQGVLHLTFNRPEARNAMSLAMLEEMQATFAAIAEDREVRVVVLRGAGGHFCDGGDIKDMARARGVPLSDTQDAVADYSRAFGRMIHTVDAAPQAVVGILEGAVLGGGFGVACVTDVAIAAPDCKFGLPETGLGITPAQIAPAVVQRIGLTQARRLGVCGGRFDGREAQRLGLVHFVEEGEEAIQQRLAEVVAQVRRCAPQAVADTKTLMRQCGLRTPEQNIDTAARVFAAGIRGDEGQEGTRAFIEKRLPRWAQVDQG